MIHLKRMGVGDTHLFKHQTFTFKPGITYVYGLNKASRTKGNSNASGKSFFFGQLPEMLYDVPVVGLKQDRTKKGKRFVEYSVGDKEVKILSAFSTAGKETITVVVDGEKKVYNTPTKGKQAIASVFRPTAEDFNTYVYVDSRVPHPLVRGSSTERRNFFTRFFGLNRIDAERKLFSSELSALLKVKAAHAELNKAFVSIKKDVLAPEEISALRAERDDLVRMRDKLQARADKAQEVKALCDFAESAGKQIGRLHEICGGTITEEAFAEAVKDAKWHVQNDTSGLKDARAWEQYQRDTQAYRTATAQVKGSKNIEDYAEQAKAYEVLLPKYRVAKEKLASLTVVERPTKQVKPEGDLDELISRRAALKTSLDHAHKFGKGACPTCGQSVRAKDPKVVTRELKEVTAAIESHQAYSEYLEDVKAYSDYKEAKTELAEQVDKMAGRLRKFKDAYTTYNVLKSVVKPKPFEGKKLEVAVKEKMLEDSKARLQLLEFCEPHLETIIEFTKLTPKQLKLREFSGDALQKVQDRLAAISVKVQMHKQVKAKVAEMQTRLTEMEEELKQEAPLRLLIQGYSDKTMKKMAIEAICQRLMALVNHFAAPYFPGFTFEFLWNTQLAIIAHRPNGESTDVRKLSGAESLLFTLVLLMSLAAFVPARKKVSALILDEPSSSFSKETTRIFHEMLPELNKIFPSIVIITPKTEEQYPGAHTYTVIRTKDGATIEEGTHDR